MLFYHRYERLLKRSRVEDLTDIAALKCIYRTGVDRFGRPVLILVGKHFPANTINMERVGPDFKKQKTIIK